MKKFLPLMTLLLGSFISQAQGLVLSENFGGYTSGNINGQGGWTVTSTFSQVQVANVAPYLAYPGYVSGAEYVNIAASGSARYARKNFITNIPLDASAVVYMSFVVRIASTPNSNAERVVVLKDEGGNDVLQFYVDRGGASTRVRFGIGTGSENAVYTPTGVSTEYALNTNYLIVIRYDIDASGNDRDDIYMWVNPSLASEPATSDANATSTNVAIDYSFGTTQMMDRLEIPKRSNTPTGSLDAFKIAYGSGNGSTAFDAAAAWSDLFPAGIALPVTFGDIRGAVKANAVKLDWTILTEVNVTRYVVERSVNGQDFEVIGSVAAARKAAYTFTDSNPAEGANYYRVRNVDLDGSNSLSQVVKLMFGRQVSSLSVFPNPVHGEHISVLTPQLEKGVYSVRILDMQGGQISRSVLNHEGGSLSTAIRLPAGMKAGVYTLEIQHGITRIYKQFVLAK